MHVFFSSRNHVYVGQPLMKPKKNHLDMMFEHIMHSTGHDHMWIVDSELLWMKDRLQTDVVWISILPRLPLLYAPFAWTQCVCSVYVGKEEKDHEHMWIGDSA